MKPVKLFQEVLSQGIADSCQVVKEDLEVTFKDYIGAKSYVEGNYGIYSYVPSGLIIWGKDNFIDTPDAVFSDELGVLVAFYRFD